MYMDHHGTIPKLDEDFTVKKSVFFNRFQASLSRPVGVHHLGYHIPRQYPDDDFPLGIGP
jgi:hypothetical protein